MIIFCYLLLKISIKIINKEEWLKSLTHQLKKIANNLLEFFLSISVSQIDQWKFK